MLTSKITLMLINKNKFANVAIGACIIIFLLFLTAMYPYTLDDWAWGSWIGESRLDRFFQGYGGRYTGYLIILALTRFQLFKVLVMTTVTFSIIYLCYKIVCSKNNTIIFLLVPILLFSMPKIMFITSFVWVSGFSNYAISALVILICLYMTRSQFEFDKPKYSNKLIIPVFIFAFISTLIVEYVSLYLICFGIFINAYYYISNRKICLSNLSFFSGALLGTLTMLSNSAYRNVVEGNDFYRHVLMGGLLDVWDKALKNYFSLIHRGIAFDNVIINFIIACCAIIIMRIFIKTKNTKINAGIISLSYITGAVLLFFPIYSVISNHIKWIYFLKFKTIIDGSYSIIFYCAILVFILIFVDNKILKSKLLFLIASILILTLPLFVVRPIWPRCFVASYILLIIFICELIKYLLPYIKNVNILNVSSKIMTVLLLAIGIKFIYIYGNIAQTNYKRIKYINHSVANKEKIIQVPCYRYESYLWHGTPNSLSGMWSKRFKIFYKIPKDTTLVYTSLKEWNRKISLNTQPCIPCNINLILLKPK